MNVIIRGSDFVSGTLQIATDPSDVGEQFFFNIHVDEGFTILGAENEMQQHVGIGLCYDNAPFILLFSG